MNKTNLKIQMNKTNIKIKMNHKKNKNKNKMFNKVNSMNKIQ